MPRFRVEYTETRWYREYVDAADEFDAREAADLLVETPSEDNTAPTRWRYSDENYDVRPVSHVEEAI